MTIIKRAGFFLSRHWDALAACAVACTFVYLFTRLSGIGISPDSVHYESAATHIRDQLSFTDFNDKPLVDFPLGYPLFLAALSKLSGCSVLKIAPWVNAALLSGLILLTGILMRRMWKITRIYRIAILSLLACSPALMEIYAMLWSETLFLFLSLLFLFALHRYVNSLSWGSLFFAASVAALACVTRYAGITFLATGAWMIFFNGAVPITKKIKHLLVFILTGVSLVVINLLRNRAAAGHSTGVREKALRTLGDNLQQAGGVLSEWLPLPQQQVATGLFLLLVTAGACLVLYRLLQQQYFSFMENSIAVFFVVYAVFIIGIASVSRFEDLSSRLLSPLYIPMLLTATSWLNSYFRRSPSARMRKAFSAMALLLLFGALHWHHYTQNAAAWEGIKDAGMPGYAESSWRDSPAVALVRAHKNEIAGAVYANANDAVYFLTGIHAEALPHKEIAGEIDAFLRQPKLCVIWFTDGENNDLVSLDFIRQHKKLRSVLEAEGGAIYYFE